MIKGRQDMKQYPRSLEKEVVRLKISVTVDQDLVKWIDDMVKTKRFRNRSHAVEWALARIVEEERKPQK